MITEKAPRTAYRSWQFVYININNPTFCFKITWANQKFSCELHTTALFIVCTHLSAIEDKHCFYFLLLSLPIIIFSFLLDISQNMPRLTANQSKGKPIASTFYSQVPSSMRSCHLCSAQYTFVGPGHRNFKTHCQNDNTAAYNELKNAMNTGATVNMSK